MTENSNQASPSTDPVTGPATPATPRRGRPKGSKNKGPAKAAPKKGPKKSPKKGPKKGKRAVVASVVTLRNRAFIREIGPAILATFNKNQGSFTSFGQFHAAFVKDHPTYNVSEAAFKSLCRGVSIRMAHVLVWDPPAVEAPRSQSDRMAAQAAKPLARELLDDLGEALLDEENSATGHLVGAD
jgi:hypothetical protein